MTRKATEAEKPQPQLGGSRHAKADAVDLVPEFRGYAAPAAHRPGAFLSTTGRKVLRQDKYYPDGTLKSSVQLIFFGNTPIELIEEDYSEKGNLTSRRVYKPNRAGVFDVDSIDDWDDNGTQRRKLRHTSRGNPPTSVRTDEYWDEEGKLRGRVTVETDPNGNRTTRTEEWDENGNKTRDEIQ